MIDDRSIQRALAAKGFYKAAIDGDFGPQSKKAMLEALLAAGHAQAKGWSVARRKIAFQQVMMHDAGINAGLVDGLVGPNTREGWERWHRLHRDTDLPPDVVGHQPNVWPRQAEVRAGAFGRPGENQVRLQLPFAMRLAWDKATIVRSFMIHAKVHDSAARVFDRILAHYGEARIQELRLDLFGGCFNHRPMRGGSQLSMHSWAIAIDFDPERNQLYWGRNKAALAKPAYDAFWSFWEQEGWVSLGRERDFDWMHVQAARL